MKINKSNNGQVLVTLLFFAIFAVAITTAAIIGNIVNAKATSTVQEGGVAVSVAESGAENALLRLLRDPSYTGEVLPVDGGSATITITGTNPKTIVSKGVSGNFSKTVQVIVSFSGTVMTVTSWKEI